MKTLLTLLLSALALITGDAKADAKNPRIATVDINAVLNAMPEARARREEFQKKRDATQKKLEAERNSLIEQEKRLKAAKTSPNSPEADKFRAAAKKFETSLQTAEEQLKTDFMKSNKEFSDRVMNAVAAHAKANKIDLVLEKQAKGRSAVLYGEPSLDITEAVLKAVTK